jgi:transposase
VSALESETKYRALLIEKLKYTIARLRHEKFGQSSERGVILEQLELSLADLEADAAKAEAKVQLAAKDPHRSRVGLCARRSAVRRPLSASCRVLLLARSCRRWRC